MTDFLSRLVAQSSGQGKLNEDGIRPLIPPFFAPATSLPEQTILWSYLSTQPITLSPALASNEAAFPPEQSEKLAMPVDLVPEHLRQAPLLSPLMRNLHSTQDIVRPDYDEIAQDVVSDYEGINDFAGSDLDTIERENVKPERDNIPGVYSPQEVVAQQQTPPYSIDLTPGSEHHQLAPSTNDQRLPLSTNDGRPTQSSPDHDSHPSPIEKLDVERREDQFAPIVPTILNAETSMSELPGNEYGPEDKRKIAHIEHQSAYHSPQPSQRSDVPVAESQHAQSGPSTQILHLDTPIEDSRYVHASSSDGSHPTTIEKFTQEEMPTDRFRNEPTLILRPQPLLLSGDLTSDSMASQSRKHSDDIRASRTAITSAQHSPHLDDPISEIQYAQAGPSADKLHPDALIPDSRRAQADPSTEAQSRTVEQFIQRRASIDSSHKNLTPNTHLQPSLPSGDLTQDNLPLQKREYIDGIPDSMTTAMSSSLSSHSDDPILGSQRAQSSPSANTQHTGDLVSNDNTARRRFRIEGVHRFRETAGPVNGYDGEIAPMLPIVQSHTIVPLIEDAVKKEATTQQAAEGGSPPPVIHIRIGRVEVRATTKPEAAPASKPARASRPGMTLSEYMQQRKEIWQ